MATFTDTAGQRWDVAITIATAMKLKSRLDIDLLALDQGEPPLMTRLALDDLLLAQVLAVILEDQFVEQCNSEAELLKRFDGETLAAASDAFWESLTDFFQGRGQAAKARAIERQQTMLRMALERAGERVEQIDLEKILGKAFGEPPASSGSTSGPSASGSSAG